ncbi:hypothetical protein HPB48_023560 [Haemaphysalis longicornis]|uniref:Uncharacterized protein n=1 Tax=Haemaphysalis longicornis TaxID=44386 RepID=A0A9J6H7N6_HAELO|nr:hypothetical protein HPB48_023560 [Haemaphysalis longicornis]
MHRTLVAFCLARNEIQQGARRSRNPAFFRDFSWESGTLSRAFLSSCMPYFLFSSTLRPVPSLLCVAKEVSAAEREGMAVKPHLKCQYKKIDEAILYAKSPGVLRGRSFLTIRHNASVFHTEEWKPRGCTMYLPLTQDVMINTRCIDQLSFETDQFFLADGKGNYIGAKSGHAIHMWRYDPASKRLFISQSVLFLREQPNKKPVFVSMETAYRDMSMESVFETQASNKFSGFQPQQPKFKERFWNNPFAYLCSTCSYQ